MLRRLGSLAGLLSPPVRAVKSLPAVTVGSVMSSVVKAMDTIWKNSSEKSFRVRIIIIPPWKKESQTHCRKEHTFIALDFSSSL